MSSSISSTAPEAPKTFTDELREAAGNQWERVIAHRFTAELASGNIDRTVLKRYLIQDHRFLDAFVVLLASIVAKAPSLEDRIPGCQFLGVITSKENTYFERAFVKLGVTREERQSTPTHPVTTKFINQMRNTAENGTFGEMLAVVVVCEWSYLSWGQRMIEQTIRKDFECYEWVDLHCGPYFESVISYLRRLLDAQTDQMTIEEKELCKQRFLETVQLEEEFFDNAFSSE